MKGKKFKLISDLNLKQKLLDSVDNIVENKIFLKDDWILKNNWIVVPVDSGEHFIDEDAENISKAIQSLNYNYCYAISTDKFIDMEMYIFEITKDGLMDFSHECFGFNYVILPEDFKFAILCTIESYFIVAGQYIFVNEVFHGKIDKARKDFQNFASNENWDERLKDFSDFLLSVSNKYSKQ